MNRHATARAFVRATAWAFLALAPAACYYAPYPYTTTVPASFDRSYNAVIGAMGDNGLSILMEDRPAGRVIGRRGGIDLTGSVISQLPPVHASSTVGSGDAALAGFAVAYERGLSDEETLSLAVACGTANCLADAPGQVSRDHVLRLAQQAQVRRQRSEYYGQTTVKAQ